MNILIATNSKFLKPAKVMLYSLFKAHPDTGMDIYLPYHDLLPEELGALCRFVSLFPGKRMYPMEVGEEFSKRVKAYGCFSIEIFYRILAIDMLPKELDRILYLDVDIIVQGNLRELYETDMIEHPFVVCEDFSAYLNGSDKAIKDRIGMSWDKPYFNSGVMLFNLDYLRKIGAGERIINEIYDKYDKLPYPDQDVMNMLFEDELIYAGWDLFNCHPAAYFLDMEALEAGKTVFATYEEIREAVQKPEAFAKRWRDITSAICANAKILHFVGASKPWNPDYDCGAAYFKIFGDVYKRYAKEAEEKNTVLVLKGASRYEVLRRAADETAKGFIKRGFNVITADTTATDFSVNVITEREYAFIFMAEAFLFDTLLKDGTPLIATVDTPWVGWIFDDILYHVGRVMQNRYAHVVLLSVDGAADRIAQQMGVEINPIYRMLHGGFEAAAVYNKDIDIFCPCSMCEEPAPPADFDEIRLGLYDGAVKLFEKEPELSARQLLEKVCGMRGISFTDRTMCELSDVVLAVTAQLRYICRKRIIDAAVGSGCKVHFAGEGSMHADGPDCIFHGPMSIDETVQMIARAKVVLNPFPTVYEEGAHERIYTAMLNRAVIFTPGYPFLRTEFGDLVEYIDISDTEGLSRRLYDAVRGYGRANGRLNRAYSFAKENTWEHRGMEIADLFLGETDN